MLPFSFFLLSLLSNLFSRALYSLPLFARFHTFVSASFSRSLDLTDHLIHSPYLSIMGQDSTSASLPDDHELSSDDHESSPCLEHDRSPPATVTAASANGPDDTEEQSSSRTMADPSNVADETSHLPGLAAEVRDQHDIERDVAQQVCDGSSRSIDRPGLID